MMDDLKSISKHVPNIHVHDAVPHHEVVNVTSSADIGMCLIEKGSLSAYYALPNKYFEYVFAGIPVIVSDFPEMGPITRKLQLGWPINPSNITEITKLIADIDCGRIAIPKIDTMKLIGYSWASQAEKLITLYKGMGVLD